MICLQAIFIDKRLMMRTNPALEKTCWLK